MPEPILLLGSTDLTVAVADAIVESGLKVGAVVHVGETFNISYAPGGVRNVRGADMPAWCAANGAEAIAFTSMARLKEQLGERRFSVGVLAGWYHMVPKAFRDRFAGSWVGLHASLLPQLRGGAPLNWAILSGLTETGVSMFEIGDGVDDGSIFDQERFSIGLRTRIADLVIAAREASVAMVQRTLPAIISGDVRPRAQIGEATYGLQRAPEDGRIDWRESAESLDRLVRAVSRPYPGALTRLDGREIALHGARPLSSGQHVLGAAGQVAILPEENLPAIVCGQGCLLIEEAQFESGEDALPALMKSGNKRLG